MQAQIRINKTPEVAEALKTLKVVKYPLLSESEIIKYLISQDYREIVQPASRRIGKRNTKYILDQLYTKGTPLGTEFLKKKGVKRENLSDEQLYDLVKET